MKYWLEVGADEQTRRLKARIDDPRKIWKLSDMDLRSYSRWYDYSRARDAMFVATDTAWAPGTSCTATTRRGARLNVISHLLSQIPYDLFPTLTSPCPSNRAQATIAIPAMNRGTSPHPTDPSMGAG